MIRNKQYCMTHGSCCRALFTCQSNYCRLFIVSQHESIWPKGQITDSFTHDWHHLAPSIFITSSHTLCYTPVRAATPFLLVYKAVIHKQQKSPSQSLISYSPRPPLFLHLVCYFQPTAPPISLN